MNYKQRIIDDQLDLKLESFGATLSVRKVAAKPLPPSKKQRVLSSSKTRNNGKTCLP